MDAFSHDLVGALKHCAKTEMSLFSIDCSQDGIALIKGLNILGPVHSASCLQGIDCRAGPLILFTEPDDDVAGEALHVTRKFELLYLFGIIIPIDT